MTAPASDTLPVLLQTALDRVVPPPEYVRWVGRPGPVRDDMDDWMGSVFGCMWTALTVPFTIAMTYLAARGAVNNGEASPGFTLLFCSGFVAVGVWMIRAPARTRNRLARTVYAVTDRRAVIIEVGLLRAAVRSFRPNDLGKLRRVDYPPRRGDVVLAERIVHDSEWGDRIELDAFSNIVGAREVEALVRELIEQSEPAAAAGSP